MTNTSLNQIKAIMAEVKNYIAEREQSSSPCFFQQIENEEIEWMCETYPAINSLPAKVFQFLWNKA